MKNQNRRFTDPSRSVASSPRYHPHFRLIAPTRPSFAGRGQLSASKRKLTPRRETEKTDLPPSSSLATSSESPGLLPSSGVAHTDSIFPTLKSSTTPISNPNNRPDEKKMLIVEQSHGDSPLPVAPVSSISTRPISLPNRPSCHTSLQKPTSPDGVSPTSPKPPLCLFPAAVGLSFSLENQIAMTLCGEVMTYDLEALEESPQVIIYLLKATNSERGNWMTVGAQYRRKGNPAAALSVVTTMVEVLTQRGVPEDDLKPAFLMLSGCETDLGKQARATHGTRSELSMEHYRKSQQWLQKVYGQQTPDTKESQTPLPGGPEPRTSLLAESDPQNNQDRSRSHLPSRPRHNPATLLSTTTSTPTPESSSSCPPVLRALEREVQSLRDHHTRQTAILNRTCATKCQLENDLAREYNLRRKLQRQLDDAERARDWAQRSEKYALEMLDTEVDTRRRKDRGSGNMAVKPLFEGFTDMFQKAAQEGTGLGPARNNPSPFPSR